MTDETHHHPTTVHVDKFHLDIKKTLILLFGLAVFLVIYYSDPWSVAIDPSGKEFVLSHEGKAAIGLFFEHLTKQQGGAVPGMAGGGDQPKAEFLGRCSARRGAEQGGCDRRGGGRCRDVFTLGPGPSRVGQWTPRPLVGGRSGRR